jgi:hypothetical protein
VGALYIGDGRDARLWGKLDGAGRILLGTGGSELEVGKAELDGTVSVGRYSSTLVIGGVEGETVFKGAAPWDRATVGRFESDGAVYIGQARSDEHRVGSVEPPHLAASAAALLLVAVPAETENEQVHRSHWERVLSAALIATVVSALRANRR